MRIHLIAVGGRMPAWVESGCDDYARRLPPPDRWRLHEVAAGRRVKGANIERLVHAEGERLLAALPKDAYVVALDRAGRALDSQALARELEAAQARRRDLAFLVGGPDGLSAQCLARADARWSLSALTLAHPIVRIVFAEQLYRAWSILKRLPYHR